MAEKHHDSTNEWAKQQEALKNSKPIPVSEALRNRMNKDIPPKNTTDDKKDNR